MAEIRPLTLAQAAERLNVTKRTLHRWVRNGMLPGAYQIPGRSPGMVEWRIPPEDLEGLKRRAPIEAVQGAAIRRCAGKTKRGGPCGEPAMRGSDFCHWHRPKDGGA